MDENALIISCNPLLFCRAPLFHITAFGKFLCTSQLSEQEYVLLKEVYFCLRTPVSLSFIAVAAVKMSTVLFSSVVYVFIIASVSLIRTWSISIILFAWSYTNLIMTGLGAAMLCCQLTDPFVCPLFILQMMKFAWDNYKRYAWGKNELRPLTRNGHIGNMFGEYLLETQKAWKVIWFFGIYLFIFKTHWPFSWKTFMWKTD